MTPSRTVDEPRVWAHEIHVMILLRAGFAFSVWMGTVWLVSRCLQALPPTWQPVMWGAVSGLHVRAGPFANATGPTEVHLYFVPHVPPSTKMFF